MLVISLTGIVVATGLTPVPIATSNFSAPFAATSSDYSNHYIKGKVLGYVGSPGMALMIWLIGGLGAFAGTL